MIGRLLDGKYRLEELCGRGGMGAVYRALHVGTGRQVAVKVIAPELAGNREFIERFRREAKTIGRLRHPNIVNVTDFGITGQNEQTLAYLVMEHLEGGTLAAKLKDKRPLPLARRWPFSPRPARRLTKPIAWAFCIATSSRKTSGSNQWEQRLQRQGAGFRHRPVA